MSGPTGSVQCISTVLYFVYIYEIRVPLKHSPSSENCDPALDTDQRNPNFGGTRLRKKILAVSPCERLSGNCSSSLLDGLACGLDDITRCHPF